MLLGKLFALEKVSMGVYVGLSATELYRYDTNINFGSIFANSAPKWPPPKVPQSSQYLAQKKNRLL